MTEYYIHTTKDNDRWDSISNKYYKTPNLYSEIIRANPDIPIEPVLQAGIKIKVPVLEEDKTIKFELPSWKK